MNLHIAYPQCSTYLHLDVEEVGTIVPVFHSRINNLYRQSIGSRERHERKEPVLPSIVKKRFHRGELEIKS